MTFSQYTYLHRSFSKTSWWFLSCLLQFNISKYLPASNYKCDILNCSWHIIFSHVSLSRSLTLYKWLLGQKIWKIWKHWMAGDNYCNTFSSCYAHYLSSRSSGQSCLSSNTGSLDSSSMVSCFSDILSVVADKKTGACGLAIY